MNDIDDPWSHEILRVVAIAIIGSLFGLAWNPSALRPSKVQLTQEPLAAAYLPTIEAKDLEAGVLDGTIQIVDSRTRILYESGHIRTALPSWDSKNEFLFPCLLKLLPLKTKIAVIGERSTAYGARRVAGLFAAKGYDQVLVVNGGMEAWRRENRAVIKGWDFEDIKLWSQKQ